MAVEAIESFLSRTPLLASLRRKDRERLAEALLASQAEYPSNTILCNEGSRGDRLYIIMEGEVEIIKALGREGQRILGVYGPGEYIGAMCLLDDEPSWASLRVRSRVRLLELTKDDFESFLFRYPYFARQIAKGLSRRFRDVQSRLLLEIQETNRKFDMQVKIIGQPKQNARELQGQLSGAEQVDTESKGASVSPGVPRLYIRTLGDFKVWRGGSPIEEFEWKGNQPKLLLKAIIARPKTVSKYVLIDDLWPEASPEAGEANFKFVLHRLRKIMEPGLAKEFKSSYISLKGGLVSLNRELCEVDLDKFISLSERGRKSADAQDLKRAHFFYNTALELYKGDFLPEDLYVPWVTLRRQEVQKRYLDLLLCTAELYQNEGSSKKAIECHRRIIEIDPLFELSYQRLMLLYSQRGQHATALKVFDDFKRYLYEELGTPPDRLTISIYQKIAPEQHAYA